MRRYRRVINHPLDSIAYKGWDDPTVPLTDLGGLGETVRAEIYSTVEKLPDHAHRWRTWYIDSQRRITRILEPYRRSRPRRARIIAVVGLSQRHQRTLTIAAGLRSTRADHGAAAKAAWQLLTIGAAKRLP